MPSDVVDLWALVLYVVLVRLEDDEKPPKSVPLSAIALWPVHSSRSQGRGLGERAWSQIHTLECYNQFFLRLFRRLLSNQKNNYPICKEEEKEKLYFVSVEIIKSKRKTFLESAYESNSTLRPGSIVCVQVLILSPHFSPPFISSILSFAVINAALPNSVLFRESREW